MPYDYVNDTDIIKMGGMLQSQGYGGDELTRTLKDAADNLEYERYKKTSSEGILPTFAKGLASGIPSVGSQVMAGLPSYIPGETFIDKGLRAGSEKVGGMVNPNYARDTAEASAGPMWGKGMGRTWAALSGQQLPVVGAGMIGSEIGGGLSGLVGTGIGAVVTPGIDPSDLPLIKSFVKGGKFAGSYASMALMETGGWNQATDQIGMDRDIQESMGRQFGAGSGLLEEFQRIGMLNPWKNKAKKTAAKVAGKKLILPILKYLGHEVAVGALEGSEEVMQGALFNRMLDVAVQTQNTRNKKRGVALISQEKVDSLKQDLKQGFIQGFGVATILRTPGHVIRGNQARVAKLYDVNKKRTLKRGELVVKDINAGATKEQITRLPALTKPSIAAAGTEQARAEAKTKVTPERLTNILNSLEVQTVKHIAKKHGVDTAQSLEQIKEELMSVTGLTEGEGPQIVKDEKNKSTVVVNKPILNKVREGEAVVGSKLDSILQKTLRDAGDNLESWFPGMKEAFKLKKDVKWNKRNKERQSIVDTHEKHQIPQLESRVRDPETTPEARLRLTKTIEKLKAEDIELKTLIAKKNYELSPINQRKRILGAFRYRALKAVKGEQIAEALLPLSEVKLSHPTNLDEVLTRKQYADYNSHLHGLIVDHITALRARDSEAKVLLGTAEEIDIKLEEATLIKAVRNDDGSETIIPQSATDNKGNPIDLPWYRRYAALLPSIEDLAYKLNMPVLMWLDHSFLARRKMADRLTTALKAGEAYLWQKIPKALRTGEPAKRMHDLVQWIGTDGEQKAKLAKTLKVKNNLTSMVARVAEVSTLKDVAEIKRHAEKLSGDYDKFYKWFVDQGFIDPINAHKKYRPVIYVYNKDDNKGDKTFVEWIMDRQKRKGKLDELTNSISKDDLKSLAKVFDNIQYWKDEEMITPGKNKAMAEYARNADREALKQFDVITDVRESYNHYIRQAVQRMVYSDLAPITSAIIIQANKVLDVKNSALFNKIIGNYLNSILGVPDNGTMWMSKKKIPTVQKGINKTIGGINKVSETIGMKEIPTLKTDPILSMTNKGIEVFNKSPLAKMYNKIEVRGKRKDISANDVLRVAMTYMYATTLGLPENLSSPIKNLTQGPLQIVAVGTLRYLTGLAHLFKPGVIKEIYDMDIRPQMAGWEMEQADIEGGGFATVAQVMLSMFRLSDLINVFSAASSGLVGWKMVEARIKKGGTTHKDITDILWRGKKGLKVNDKDVMNPKKSILKDPWHGVISKPVDLMINEMIDQGKMNEAKDLYVKYLVEFSQWRYGPGGTPQYMGNSIVKAAFMYTTWPTNYTDYVIRARRPGMMQRYMQVAASQIVLATLLSGMGYSAWRWILMGPFPKELFPVGPLASLVEELWGILHGSAEALAAGIIPTVPDEEYDKQMKRLKSQVNDIIG